MREVKIDIVKKFLGSFIQNHVKKELNRVRHQNITRDRNKNVNEN